MLNVMHDLMHIYKTRPLLKQSDNYDVNFSILFKLCRSLGGM